MVRHRHYTEFRVKLTPKHDNPICAQSLPTPTNKKDEILVEPALMHEYDVVTTLLFSKNCSLIFAKRKPNVILGLLVDLTRSYHLIKLNYIEHNHPVFTIADAAQHMASKKSWTVLQLGTACRWLTNSPSTYCLSTSVTKRLPTTFSTRSYPFTFSVHQFCSRVP